MPVSALQAEIKENTDQHKLIQTHVSNTYSSEITSNKKSQELS